MTRDVPASETRANMPVARPCDMRFSRNSRYSLRSRRSPIYFLAPATQATVAKGKEEALEPSQQSGFQQPGFWITMLGFRIPLAGFRIPKPWIPDSTDQNYLDSGFRITLHNDGRLKKFADN